MPHEYKKPHYRKKAEKPARIRGEKKPVPKKELKPGYYIKETDDFVTKFLYWCPACNIPLLAKTCACGNESVKISLQQPYDVRPALKTDHDLISSLIKTRFGDAVTLPKILVLNKAGGLDRNDLIIANGVRFAWLWFDPVARKFNLDLEAEALPYLIGKADKGIIDLEKDAPELPEGRLGGKKVKVTTTGISDGVVILRYKNKYGTGILKDGSVRIKELISVSPIKSKANPSWEDAVEKNAFHIKNMERNAVREIRQNAPLKPRVNCSFSGGKDSTAVWNIAKKAGVTEAFFIDTGLEFPETIDFVKSQDVELIQKAGDFWQAVEKAGPPGKDHRWCCKLLKLNPLKVHLNDNGECLTIQGNRWYESWSRASLEALSQNPTNPLQLNLSPIRSWRALDVFFYLWLRELPYNPLYERGYERIGCYLCPAMLESELETLRVTHPEMADRWHEFLTRWADERGLPPEFVTWGLWRWKELTPKMQELVKEAGLDLTEKKIRRSTPASVAHLMPADKVTDIVEDWIQTEPETEKTSEPDWDALRREFPMMGDLMYFDNGATTWSPECVLAATDEFERQYRANVGRGVHRLTRIATQKYWHAHEKAAEFINGSAGTTVFVKNTTEAVNMIAKGLSFKEGDVIVTTILEHHSNLLPWRALEAKGVTLRIVGLNDDLTLNMKEFEAAMDASVRLVAVTHASNVTGTITPIAEISRLCKKYGSLLAVDAAQSVPRMPVDVEKLGVDFLSFSGHKMFGPMGTGVLWMRDPVLEPLLLGGGMVESVTEDGYVPAEGYHKYEAGTPNVSGGIGLGAAVEFLSNIGMKHIEAHERKLTDMLIDGLAAIPGVTHYACRDRNRRIGVVSFTVEGFAPHEIAEWLDDEHGIEIRSGMHCAEPLMRYLSAEKGTARACISFYNTESEVNTFIAVIRELTGT